MGYFYVFKWHRVVLIFTHSFRWIDNKARIFLCKDITSLTIQFLLFTINQDGEYLIILFMITDTDCELWVRNKNPIFTSMSSIQMHRWNHKAHTNQHKQKRLQCTSGSFHTWYRRLYVIYCIFRFFASIQHNLLLRFTPNAMCIVHV